jgi:NADH-quinone oxidoreductase subunit F
MTGTTICVLSDSAAAPVASSIHKFRDEYIARMRAPAGVPFPIGALTG